MRRKPIGWDDLGVRGKRWVRGAIEGWMQDNFDLVPVEQWQERLAELLIDWARQGLKFRPRHIANLQRWVSECQETFLAANDAAPDDTPEDGEPDPVPAGWSDVEHLIVLDTLDNSLGPGSVLSSQEDARFDFTPGLGEMVVGMGSSPAVVEIGRGTDDTNWQYAIFRRGNETFVEGKGPDSLLWEPGYIDPVSNRFVASNTRLVIPGDDRTSQQLAWEGIATLVAGKLVITFVTSNAPATLWHATYVYSPQLAQVAQHPVTWAGAGGLIAVGTGGDFREGVLMGLLANPGAVSFIGNTGGKIVHSVPGGLRHHPSTASPKTPVGRSGSPQGSVAGNSPTSIEGRPYSAHAIDRMQGRGITPSAVESAIRGGASSPGKYPGTTVHYDSVNNISVVVDTATGRVVTVSQGRF